jgi:hypothetical protein
MLLVLHGARKNVGDFLIRERGLALLRQLRPDQELVIRARWRPVDPALMARADAVVLCGGPGLSTNFYPGTFPLVENLERTATPILPLALGWSGMPADQPERFAFDKPSRAALVEIHNRIGWSSVRDDLSLRVLENARVGAVRRSGCTAWYHLPSLGKVSGPPRRVRRLVFTPPQRVRKHWVESIQLMRAVRTRYPSAERYCVFHRDLRHDANTPWSYSTVTQAIAFAARRLGYQIVDAAYDLGRIGFYGECDLHIGYRVHAHLSFSSQRRPSVLVCEDGRGIGQLVTLHDRQPIMKAGDPDLPEKLLSALDAEERESYPSLASAVEEIERTWPVMRDTIGQLPSGS